MLRVACSILTITFASLGCESAQRQFPEYGGTLLIESGDHFAAYDMITGTVTWLNTDMNTCSFSPITYVLKDSSIVVSSCSKDELVFSLYRYHLSTGSRTVMTGPDDTTTVCKFLDYDAKRDAFLFVGVLRGSEGVYIVDERLQILEDLTKFADSCVAASRTKVTAYKPMRDIRFYFKDTNTLIFSVDTPITLMADLSSREYWILDSTGTVMDVSHDKNSVLIGSKVGKRDLITRLWLESLRRDTVVVDNINNWSCCFSPNDQIIAYGHIADSWGTGAVSLWSSVSKRSQRIEFEPNHMWGKSLVWVGFQLPRQSSEGS